MIKFDEKNRLALDIHVHLPLPSISIKLSKPEADEYSAKLRHNEEKDSHEKEQG